jgi:hypothetical protein
VATPAEHNALVAEARLVMKRRDDAIAELKQLEEKILALGPGRYTDGEKIAQVIGAVPGSIGPESYALQSKDDEDRAREICGEEFKKLFDRTVFYRPCAGFAEVAPKILTRAKARDVADLCRVPGATISGKRAHLRWL